MSQELKKLKVAELRELCEQRGIDHSGLKKQELIDALEAATDPIEVEAEIIEDSIEHVGFKPGVINAQAYLDDKRQWFEKMMRPYKDMTDEAICAMDAEEAKICCADINRIIKEVEEERKAIKRAYNEPLDLFEKAVKELLEPAREDAGRLKMYIDDQEEVQRDFRRRGLEATYNDFAPALVEVVPFERLLETNPKWLNKSYGAAKAAQELEDTVEKIANDWEILKRQASIMKCYDEAEAVFFRTLDISAAIAHNEMREQEMQRIANMKADVAANQAAQHQEPQYQEQDDEAHEPHDGQPERDIQQQRKPYVIRIEMTDDEKRLLLGFIKLKNIGSNRFIGIQKEVNHA